MTTPLVLKITKYILINPSFGTPWVAIFYVNYCSLFYVKNTRFNGWPGDSLILNSIDSNSFTGIQIHFWGKIHRNLQKFLIMIDARLKIDCNNFFRLKVIHIQL
jgi:hypothetical protein